MQQANCELIHKIQFYIIVLICDGDLIHLIAFASDNKKATQTSRGLT